MTGLQDGQLERVEMCGVVKGGQLPNIVFPI